MVSAGLSLVGLVAGAVAQAGDDAGNDAGDDDLFGDITAEDLWVPTVRIFLILLLALVVHMLVRRAIGRFVRRVMDPGTNQALSRLRRRAPSMMGGSSMLADRATSRARTLAHVLSSVATTIIWSIAVVTILGELGVNLGPLIAGAGIVGVALGFGAQSLVKDFLTGFFMLVEDQCGVGDIVDLGDATGVVEAVSLRTTRIRDLNGTLWHIPNGEIARVGNLSQEWSRAVLDLSVAYGTDLDLAQRVIKEAADELWHDADWESVIVEEPEVWGVEDLGVDAVTIRLVLKTEPAEQWRVTRELRQRVAKALEESEIEIPFQQRTIWHRQTESLPGNARRNEPG